MFVGRGAGRVAESFGSVVVGPARQGLGFDRTGMAGVRTATDQPAGQSHGRARKPSPPGEPDELPPTDRPVDDSMILSYDVPVHRKIFLPFNDVNSLFFSFLLPNQV